MDALAGLGPGFGIADVGATGALVVVFFMVMTGKLATPAHQRELRARITYLEQVVKDQRDAVTGSVQNARAVEQVGAVVSHAAAAITQKAEAQ
jgi:hypothetical protein